MLYREKMDLNPDSPATPATRAAAKRPLYPIKKEINSCLAIATSAVESR
jgi:hypothetical protein